MMLIPSIGMSSQSASALTLHPFVLTADVVHMTRRAVSTVQSDLQPAVSMLFENTEDSGRKLVDSDSGEEMGWGGGGGWGGNRKTEDSF